MNLDRFSHPLYSEATPPAMRDIEPDLPVANKRQPRDEDEDAGDMAGDRLSDTPQATPQRELNTLGGI